LPFLSPKRLNQRNFHYQYCNHNDIHKFFLLHTYIENAKNYCNEKIIKVKIAIKDIGAIVRKENKIRCFKFKVIEEVKDQ